MARVIKLKESDITNIVRRILREEKNNLPKGKKKGSKETPTSSKGLKKLTKSQWNKVIKEYGLMDSMDSLQKGYRKMYNMAPKWAKSESLSPAELKRQIDNDPDPSPAAFCIILAVFSWGVALWAFGYEAGWWSDSRLKENINRTGVSKTGIPIYTFNYKNDDTLWSGTMAQDLISMGMGRAVKTMDNGYYSVDYNMIDVDMISKN